MGTTFSKAPSLLLTSESVTEGHPDKLCDQISDAVLDACLREDPESRVACETAAAAGLIMVFGEITSKAPIEVEAIVRQTAREIGYTHADYGLDAATCRVAVALSQQ